MSKKFSKSIVFVVTVLVILSIFLLINGGFNNKKNNELNSRYYDSFVSSVQMLNQGLDQIDNNKNSEDIAALVFDVYTAIIDVNDRMDFLKNNAATSLELDVLENDLIWLRINYASVVRNQISDKDSFNLQVHKELEEHIQLFINELPKEYEKSKDFDQQFSRAAERIEPIMNMNFFSK
ncbi:hypothetical protein M3231_16195 [Neobacillus mesonae]|nr:hypothetical protein [Neobacillus mesonae]